MFMYYFLDDVLARIVLSPKRRLFICLKKAVYITCFL